MCADSSLTTLYIWNVRCVTRVNWSHRFRGAIVRWAWVCPCAQDVVVARPMPNDDCKIIAWPNLVGSFGAHWQQQPFLASTNTSAICMELFSVDYRNSNVLIESADACLQHLQELFFYFLCFWFPCTAFKAVLCAFSIK